MSLREALMKLVPVEQPQPMQMAQAAPNFAPVRDRSQLADALLARSARPAQNWGEAVNQIASAFAGRRIMDRQQDQEQKRNSALYSALMGESDPQKQAAIMMQAGDPSLFNTITATNLQKQLNPPDPMDVEAKRLGLEKSKAELAQLQNPQRKPPAVQTFYDDKGGEYKAQFNPQTGEWQQVGGSKAPSNGITVGPDGTVQIGGTGKLTEGQSKDINYYTRGIAANDALSTLDSQLTNLSGQMAGNAGVLGNYMKTPEYRQAERAGREFLAVILRKDTGAAITAQEFDIYGPMYLPQPGDDAKTLADKAAARSLALEAMDTGLGSAAPLGQRARDRQQQRKDAADPVQPPAPGPTQGMVEDGYRFKGGDPADPNSWEKVR